MGAMSDKGQGARGPTPHQTAPETRTQPVPGGGGTAPAAPPTRTPPIPGEVGGPSGPEPTRYGDWERKGRVSDF